MTRRFPPCLFTIEETSDQGQEPQKAHATNVTAKSMVKMEVEILINFRIFWNTPGEVSL